MFNSISNRPVLLDGVHCTGYEDALLECSHSAIGNHLCGQFLQDEASNVAIQCQGNVHLYSTVSKVLCMLIIIADDCVDGQVRLQDGTDNSNGRVEMCQNGIWGSVCSTGWEHIDASVVCRQLGYVTEGVTNLSIDIRLTICTYYSCPLRCGSHGCFWTWRICVSE